MAEFEREFGWDDEIENDQGEWVLLPDGKYPFTVKSYERKRFGGSTKLPPCNQAELTIEIDGGEAGTTTVKHSLFLHSKTEGLLCAFFTAIGQRKHGEKMKMNWPAVPGSKGECMVYVDTWTGNDGQERKSNKIQKFLEPEEAGTTPSPNISYRDSGQSGPPAGPHQNASSEEVSRGESAGRAPAWKVGSF